MSEIARLLRYSKPYSHVLAIAVVLMSLVGASQALMARLVVPLFDRVLSPASLDKPVTLFAFPGTGWTLYLHDLMPSWVHNIWTAVAVAIVIAFFTKGICDYIANYLISYAGFSAVTDLRQQVYDRLLHQDATFFQQTTTGGLMSSIMNDIEKIQQAVSHLLADWFRQAFTVIALLAVVIQTNGRMALVSLTVLPFVLVPTLRLGRKIRRTTRSAQDQTAELNQVLQETLSGHQVVKTFGNEEVESNRFREIGKRLLRSNLRYVLQQAIASPLIEFFGALTIVGLLTYARSEIKAERMTAGEFTSFVIALLLLYEPVKRLAGIHNIFQQALGASQKVFEYLDRRQHVEDKPGATKLAKLHKSIAFDGVSFHYPGVLNGFALREIDLEVRVGEIVALCGPSGSGKTTLANLLPRFYDVTAGAIRIDGRDIREIQLASLREKIGIVAQDTFLFNDTAANNIGYGRPGATRAEIRDAAKAALADEFIERMPDGYETVIGERGQKLSGGQRQRISIARALLKNAPILILDEATSHLDTESESLVQKALSNLMANRTVLIIAHRLSTVRRADRIVVLDQGRITEIGTHEELVGGGGIYQRLHDLQFLETDA